ncbi:MAG: hypothetical protein ACEPOW_10140 [Bacteroidales bacterium]
MAYKRFFSFIALIILQVFFFDKMQFNIFLHPFPYVLFILSLPFEIPGYLLLFSAFFLGLGVDFMTNSMGFHTAACVLMAGLRPFVIRSLIKRIEDTNKLSPNIASLGVNRYLAYAASLIFIHHICLFALEAFNIIDIFKIIQRSILSGLFTLLWVLIFQYLFTKRNSKKTRTV